MVFEKLREIIVVQLDVDKEDITMGAFLVEELGCDELDLIEISMAIEDEFDIEIPDDEWEKLDTVEEVVKYIEGKI